MSLSCVSCGVTEMACSCWQLDRVDIDPRRSTVGFGDQNDVESFFSFTIIKIDLGQLPFLFDVFLAVNLGMSSKKDIEKERQLAEIDVFLAVNLGMSREGRGADR